MTAVLYRSMVETARGLIERRAETDDAWKWENIELISGGAAWSDHVAVSLFLAQQIARFPLVLHLPTRFDSEGERFVADTVGGVANFHHEKLQRAPHHQLQVWSGSRGVPTHSC